MAPLLTGITRTSVAVRVGALLALGLAVFAGVWYGRSAGEQLPRDAVESVGTTSGTVTVEAAATVGGTREAQGSASTDRPTSTTAAGETTVADAITLTTRVTGPGTLTPAGTTNHARGSLVDVQATPNEGKYLRAWGGSCDGVAIALDTCGVDLDANATVTATFGDEPVNPMLLVVNDGSNTSLLLEWFGYPDGVTRWEYRQREWTGSDEPQWGDWTRIPNSTSTTRSYRVTSLTTGSLYGFQVRAVVGSKNGKPSVGALYDHGREEHVPPRGTPAAAGTHSMSALRIIEGDGTTKWIVADFTIVIPDGVRMWAGQPWVGTCATEDGCVDEGVPLRHYDTGSSLMFDLDGDEVERHVVEDGSDGVPGESGPGSTPPTMTVDEVFDQIVASIKRVSE